MSLLARINQPADEGSEPSRAGLAGEIRDFLIRQVAATGGHLGPNLGVAALRQRLHAWHPKATVEAEDNCPVAVLTRGLEGARDVGLVPVVVIHLCTVSVIRLDQPGRAFPSAARFRSHRTQHLLRAPPPNQCQGVAALHHVVEERRGADPGVVVSGHKCIRRSVPDASDSAR